MWEKRISHAGLNAYRVVKGQTQYDVAMKVAAQEAVWEKRWQAHLRAEEARNVRETKMLLMWTKSQQTAEAKDMALEQTRDLEEARAKLETILKDSLSADPTLDWRWLKDFSKFATPKPTSPVKLSMPPEVDANDALYQPEKTAANLSLLDYLIPSRKRTKTQAAREANEAAKTRVEERLAKALSEQKDTVAKLEAENLAAEAAFHSAQSDWEKAKAEYLQNQLAQHEEIDRLEKAYWQKDGTAVAMYVEEVLNRSEYPDSFPKEQSLSFVSSTGTLVIDYELPAREAFPTVKEIKYQTSRLEFQEVSLPETWIKKTYDEVLYQIALRTLSELFRSDAADALVSIVFNGWVRSIDRSTGSPIHACVLSVDARKDEFLALNLDQVDSKACFKKLKGVSASKLIELAPVKPLVTLSKEDARFVEGYSVVDGIDERTNLAAMDWLDFENLIREVFEKEFSKGGGEVKITQASRDGGVDAVAFDPDPIRGGKIVIQAKRYTNTVGVSAVRDLYGTVHNEGANKGILVATSDFGPDAYAFAKDKPLTLLSGGELLYLLSQHGHNAKIDLAEAKRLAAEAAR